MAVSKPSVLSSRSGHVKGLDTVLKNLNLAIIKIHGNIQKGLTLGMLKVKRDSMASTPVDTGNLKNSHYLVSSSLVSGSEDVSTETSFDTSDASGAKVAAQHEPHVSEAKSRASSKAGPFAELGCTAFYAETVHEDLEASHTKMAYLPKGQVGPPKQFQSGKAKFMEDAIRSNQSSLIKTVKRFAKV